MRGLVRSDQGDKVPWSMAVTARESAESWKQVIEHRGREALHQCQGRGQPPRAEELEGGDVERRGHQRITGAADQMVGSAQRTHGKGRNDNVEQWRGQEKERRAALLQGNSGPRAVAEQKGDANVRVVAVSP